MSSERERDKFGYMLEEVLKGLPEKATPFLKVLAIVVEDRPTSGRPRLWDASSGALKGNPSWTNLSPGHDAIMQAAGRITLYIEPILAEGGDTSAVLHDAILRALEGKLGVDRGSLEREVGEEGLFWQAEDPDEPEEIVHDPAAPESSDALVELAECEIELLSLGARDWFDEVEIAAVDHPEAEGDPSRLADFPEADDEPKAVVLYTQNILKAGQPVEIVVRGLLREAATRAGAM
ncbi:MAG: hypothetical protein FD180_4378 [Planctomycetota bacterium]|nr:MAG: hypothetical protein FD180_4378 [Planctomycetota bacterium]